MLLGPIELKNEHFHFITCQLSVSVFKGENFRLSFLSTFLNNKWLSYFKILGKFIATSYFFIPNLLTQLKYFIHLFTHSSLSKCLLSLFIVPENVLRMEINN